MFELNGMTLLFLATAAFGLLLFILAAVAVITVYVNRHRPTVAEVAGAEERKQIIEAQLDKAREDLHNTQARLAEADKKAAEVAWLEERLATLRVEIEQEEPRRHELVKLQNELEQVLTELGDARRELDEKLEKLNRENESEAKLGRLEGQIEAAKEELAQLPAKLSELEALRDEATHLRSQRLAAQEETERAQEKLTELQGKIGALESRAEDLRGEIGSDAAALGGDKLADLKKAPSSIDRLRAAEYKPTNAEDDTEAAYLHRAAQSIKDAGLTFHSRTIKAFHTALKVAPEAPMTVLAGISGTGKTQLPRRYAEGMGIGFLPMPVQPRWDSPQDLLGFYNFIEQRYKPTELSRAMYQLDGKGDDPEILVDRMLLVLLDEMNLARVEYYFSEFLSRLELRPRPEEAQDGERRMPSEIVIEVPGEDDQRIFPGHNILFAGTMNEDESTQALSDKVLDRGNMLRFPPPNTLENAPAELRNVQPAAPLSFSKWRKWRRANASFEGDDLARNRIEALSEQMKELGRPFGHRVAQAMLAYIANYPAPEGRVGSTLDDALADQVEMRLLPKLRGIEMEEGGSRLERFADFVRDTLNDEDLAAAIEISIEQSQETDRFAWRGLAR